MGGGQYAHWFRSITLSKALRDSDEDDTFADIWKEHGEAIQRELGGSFEKSGKRYQTLKHFVNTVMRSQRKGEDTYIDIAKGVLKKDKSVLARIAPVPEEEESENEDDDDDDEEMEEEEEEDAAVEEMEVDQQPNGGTNNGTAAAAEGQLAALAQARNDLAQSRDDLVQARNEITQSRAALAQAHNEIAQSRDDLAEARNDLAKVAAMITDLGGDLSEAYGEVVKAVGKNEAKNDELDEVPARVLALEEELTEVRRSYKALLDMQLGEGVLV